MEEIEFPAGVTSLLSKVAKVTNWREGNLVRWENGTTLKPVGGWEQIAYSTQFASRVRAVHRWTATSGIVYTAYLCEQHAYIDDGGSLLDITPLGGMAAGSGVEAGYGEQNYSISTYGTPRPGESTLQKFSQAWSINNWGEDLLVMTSYDGRLLIWKPSVPGSKLTAVPNAPINNRQFVVTPEHHCMLFGMGGNFADFGWCSEEDIEDWNFANPLNTAGEFTLDPYSPIVSAHSSSIGILTSTPAMSHLIEFIGLPYVYRYRPIGKVPVPISAASVSSIPEGIVWISVEGFWMYNGSTADVIPCPIWDTVSKNMDFQRTVRESHSVSLLSKGEIWWFWVDNKLGLECSRYAAIAYRPNRIWMGGYLNRTCGLTYANDRFPIMSDGWRVWKHETGFVYPEALFMPFIESHTLNVLDGEYFNTITKALPEISGDKTAVAFSLAMVNDRTNNASEKYSAKRKINGHGWVDIRETARDARFRIDMVANADWGTIGPILFDIKPRGKKI